MGIVAAGRGRCWGNPAAAAFEGLPDGIRPDGTHLSITLLCKPKDILRRRRGGGRRGALK